MNYPGMNNNQYNPGQQNSMMNIYQLTSETQFNLNTSAVLIKSFGKTMPGHVSPAEYQSLKQCVQKWQQIFFVYDKDRSGTISMEELNKILCDSGYRIQPETVRSIVSFSLKLQKQGQHQSMVPVNDLNFDTLIFTAFVLERMTSKFKMHDNQRNGIATYNYDDYIRDVTEIIDFCGVL
ncbi:Apoptosis-linked protein [Intoshia linei]|uniref:Apoptosis-linked protein n=1 Tax=Intoshia linei TaxID=1819745 RepID=A0A177AVN2_9BILA|nr:Apoptosis-linked protein [Intoshia linei]